MRILKYKNIEYSEIMFSELEGKIRIDSEFYQPLYLKIVNKIKSLNNKSFSQLGTNIIHPSEIKRTYSETGHQILLAQNIRNNILDFSNKVFMPEKTVEKFLFRNKLLKNDVLMTRSGANFGQTSYYDSNPKIIYACADCLIIRSNSLNGKYISTYLNTDFGKLLIERGSYGMAQPHIAPSYLYTMPISIPSEHFQKETEKLIIESQKLKDDSEKLYKEAEDILLDELGLLNWKPKTVSFKLNGVKFEVDDTISKVLFDKNYKYDRIDSEFWQPKFEEFRSKLLKNKNIKLTALGNLVNWKKGVEIGSSQYLEEGEFPFIRVSNLTKNGIDLTSSKFICKDVFDKLENYHIKNGDILFSKDGTAGISYLVRDDLKGITSSGILRLTNISKIQSEYLELVLNSIVTQMQIERKISGALIQHLKVSEAMNFKIPIVNSVNEVSKKVNSSYMKRFKSKQLLDTAKQSVEIFIDKNENHAMDFIKSKTKT